MMLPPFVPPSARGNREALPSITEFISVPQERSFSESVETATLEPVEVPLPEITEFLIDRRPSPPESRSSEDGWMEEERNAFDWQSVSMLAIRQNEERRADEEWTATSWEKGATSTMDHVATMLMQVAKRVRSGELRVEGSQEMSAEAALAVTLTALLQTKDR